MNIYIPADQLVENPFPLWNDHFRKLLNHPETILTVSPTFSDSEKTKLETGLKQLYNQEALPNFVCDVSEISEKNIYLDFVGLSLPVSLPNKIRKIGFLSFNDDIPKKLEFYRSSAFEGIVSEIMPDEIPCNLRKELIIFFLTKCNFLPPCQNAIKIQKSSSPRIVVFESPDQPASGAFNITKPLEKLKGVEFSNISKLRSSKYNLDASSIVLADTNPQLHHCLRLASPVPTQILDNGISIDSPLRNFFFKSHYLNPNLIFPKKNLSIRESLTSAFKSTNEPFQCPTPVEDDSKQHERMLEFITEGKRLFDFSLPSDIIELNNSFSKSESSYAKWFFHPATEPLLMFLAKSIIGNDSKFKELDKKTIDFALDALCIIQMIDRSNLYLDRFSDLFDFKSVEVRKRFHQLCCTAHSTFGPKTKDGSNLHAEIAYKYIKKNFTTFFRADHAFLDLDTDKSLVSFMDLANENEKNSPSSKRYRLILLILTNQEEKAFEFCKNQESISIKNLLFVTMGLCFLLLKNLNLCRNSLKGFVYTESQYGKDYVFMVYLLCDVLISDSSSETYLSILEHYRLRKPSSKWWKIDLTVFAILINSKSLLNESLHNMYKLEAKERFNFKAEKYINKSDLIMPDSSLNKSKVEKFISLIQ